jgi:hypothetical protein
MICGVAGLIIYFIALLLFRVPAFQTLVDALKNKLKKRRA